MIDSDLLMLRRTFTPEEAADNKVRTAGLTESRIQRALYWKHQSSAAVVLPNYTPPWWYECDLFVVSKAGYSIEYEVKLSLADFKADFRKQRKHARLAGTSADGRRRPTRFFYAVPEMLVSPRDVPDYAGLLYLSVLRNRPMFSPRITVIRHAPRLGSEKLTEKTVQEMHRTSYYRFWSERFRFEEYRQHGSC